MPKSIFREQKTILGVICIYILGTFLLSIIGPITFLNYNYFRVMAFLIVVLVGLWLGTYLSKISLRASMGIRNEKTIQLKESKSENYIKYANFCIIFSLILYVILFIELITEMEIGFFDIFSNLSNLGEIYKTYLHKEVHGVDNLVRINTLLGGIPFCAMCGGIYYFRNDKLHKKFFLAFMIISIVEELLRNGQIAYIGSWVMSFGIIFLLKQIKRIPKTHENARIKQKRRIYLLIVGVIFFIAFGSIQNSRGKVYNYSMRGISNSYFFYNGDHIVYKILPGSIGDAVASFSFYLCGGYYGLDKNLDTEFIWTYGYGNSKALSGYLNQYLGWKDTFEDTYPLRTEKKTGYPSGQYWGTVFPWLAGDVSFLGIPILMAIIMVFYMKIYKIYRIKNNFFALLLFIRLSQFFIFVPANNYIMQTRQNLMITITLVIFYFFSILNVRVRARMDMRGDERESLDCWS